MARGLFRVVAAQIMCETRLIIMEDNLEKYKKELRELEMAVGGGSPIMQELLENYKQLIDNIKNHKPTENDKCPHCKFISKTLPSAEDMTDREYWLLTEVFVYLHGTDYCNFNKEHNE